MWYISDKQREKEVDNMAGKTLNDRTKRLIADAFEETLERSEKRVEKVTVTEICQRAGVNRKTFYYHFKDIRDLADWTFRECGREIAQNSNYVEHPSESIEYFVRYVLQHRVLYRELANYFGIETLKQMGFSDQSIFVLPETFRTVSAAGHEGQENYRFFSATFFSEAICDVLYHKITQGSSFDEDQLIDYAKCIWQAISVSVLEMET